MDAYVHRIEVRKDLHDIVANDEQLDKYLRDILEGWKRITILQNGKLPNSAHISIEYKNFLEVQIDLPLPSISIEKKGEIYKYFITYKNKNKQGVL